MTEDYVSFETAKLLKEKGFDGSCYKVWESHGDSQTLVGASWFVEGETVVNRESVDAAAKRYAYEYSLNNNVEGYLAPTLQMTMKWLREVHKLFITIEIKGDPRKQDFIYFKWSVAKYSSAQIKRIDNGLDSPEDYWIAPYEEDETYERACEAAIKYCLENLI